MKNNVAFDPRLAAIEILLFAAIRQLNADEFRADYADVKGGALAKILNNPTVSEKNHDTLEEILKRYEKHLRLTPSAQ